MQMGLPSQGQTTMKATNMKTTNMKTTNMKTTNMKATNTKATTTKATSMKATTKARVYRVILPVVLPVLALWLSPARALAERGFENRIPNGSVDVSHDRGAGCANCHVLPNSTSLNQFGRDWNSASRSWGPALAAKDSDDDDVPNGWELGDPEGSWSRGEPAPGNATIVSSPGQKPSVPPVLSVDPIDIEHAETAGENLWEIFTVSNIGGSCSGNVNGACTLAAEIGTEEDWMSPDPVSLELAALESAEVDVLFTTDGLEGFFEGVMTVSAPGVYGTPQDVLVALTVPEPGAPLLAAAAISALAVLRPRRSG